MDKIYDRLLGENSNKVVEAHASMVPVLIGLGIISIVLMLFFHNMVLAYANKHQEPPAHTQNTEC